MIFSVIIPTFHRIDLLSVCLERLSPEKQNFLSEYYEVIVTDDGREITAEKMVEELFPWVKWVKGPCKGPAANRNYGASVSQGDYLVFIYKQ